MQQPKLLATAVWKTLLAGAAILVCVIIAVSLFLGTRTGPTGNPAVYDRISATTDCAQLLQEFSQAEASHHGDYMAAADKRMTDLGCYGR